MMPRFGYHGVHPARGYAINLIVMPLSRWIAGRYVVFWQKPQVISKHDDISHPGAL